MGHVQEPCPCPAAHRQGPWGGACRAATDDIGLGGRRGPTPHPGAPTTHSLGISVSIFVSAFQSKKVLREPSLKTLLCPWVGKALGFRG